MKYDKEPIQHCVAGQAEARAHAFRSSRSFFDRLGIDLSMESL